MFSIIVMVAIVTSFMAPVGLRLTMPRVRMTEEETKRILASASKGAFDPQRVRVLLATGGGPSAIAAAPLAFGLARAQRQPAGGGLRRGEDRLVAAHRAAASARRTPGNVSQHIDALKSPASNPWNDARARDPPGLGAHGGAGDLRGGAPRVRPDLRRVGRRARRSAARSSRRSSPRRRATSRS